VRLRLMRILLLRAWIVGIALVVRICRWRVDSDFQIYRWNRSRPSRLLVDL
jgi:hypothetical protein